VEYESCVVELDCEATLEYLLNEAGIQRYPDSVLHYRRKRRWADERVELFRVSFNEELYGRGMVFDKLRKRDFRPLPRNMIEYFAAWCVQNPECEFAMGCMEEDLAWPALYLFTTKKGKRMLDEIEESPWEKKTMVLKPNTPIIAMAK
jgi:hypothetical protein